MREIVKSWSRWVVGLIVPAALLTACGGGTGGTAFSSGTPGNVPTPDPGNGTITLVWDSPTTNADQSCLTALSGYRISYGASSQAYSASDGVTVNAASCVDSGTEPVSGCGNMRVCTYTVRGFGRGVWYLAVQAYDADGNLSNFSNEVVRQLQ